MFGMRSGLSLAMNSSAGASNSTIPNSNSSSSLPTGGVTSSITGTSSSSIIAPSSSSNHQHSLSTGNMNLPPQRISAPYEARDRLSQYSLLSLENQDKERLSFTQFDRDNATKLPQFDRISVASSTMSIPGSGGGGVTIPERISQVDYIDLLSKCKRLEKEVEELRAKLSEEKIKRAACEDRLAFIEEQFGSASDFAKRIVDYSERIQTWGNSVLKVSTTNGNAGNASTNPMPSISQLTVSPAAFAHRLSGSSPEVSSDRTRTLWSSSSFLSSDPSWFPQQQQQQQMQQQGHQGPITHQYGSSSHISQEEKIHFSNPTASVPTFLDQSTVEESLPVSPNSLPNSFSQRSQLDVHALTRPQFSSTSSIAIPISTRTTSTHTGGSPATLRASAPEFRLLSSSSDASASSPNSSPPEWGLLSSRGAANDRENIMPTSKQHQQPQAQPSFMQATSLSLSHNQGNRIQDEFTCFLLCDVSRDVTINSMEICVREKFGLEENEVKVEFGEGGPGAGRVAFVFVHPDRASKLANVKRFRAVVDGVKMRMKVTLLPPHMIDQYR